MTWHPLDANMRAMLAEECGEVIRIWDGSLFGSGPFPDPDVKFGSCRAPVAQ